MIVVGIREAQTMDVPRITELSEQLGYRVTEEGTRTRLEYLIQEKNNVIFVAEVNNRVVGPKPPFRLSMVQLVRHLKFLPN